MKNIENKRRENEFDKMLVVGKKFEGKNFEITISRIFGNDIELIVKDIKSEKEIIQKKTRKYLSNEFKKGNIKEKTEENTAAALTEPVSAEVKKADTKETTANSNEVKDPKYKEGTKIIIKRTSGNIENDWWVMSTRTTSEGRVVRAHKGDSYQNPLNNNTIYRDFLESEIDELNTKKSEVESKDPGIYKPGDVVEMTGDNLETITKVGEEEQKSELEEKKVSGKETKEVLETISDEEYKNYVDTNTVSESRIKDLAEKQKRGEPLSKREQAIFSNNINKIEQELSETKTVEETPENTKEVKVEAVKNEVTKVFEKEEKVKEDKEIGDKLKNLGLNEADFENTPAWKNFSKAEKLLILEQAAQDTLSRVREIGEKRFEEKNKIERSWNPLKWRASAITKTWHKMGKSFWISKEEKEVLSEVEQGKMKPDEKTLGALIERQSELGLSVVEKDGKAFIEFAETNKELSKEQKILIDKFNRIANNFSQVPDSWRNERSAKSTDKMLTTENHKKFEGMKKEYEDQKALLIESKVKQYEASGMSKVEAKEKAMMDAKEIDFKISMLQFTNTNPDAISELNKIKNESSWGRLVNNENIWRAGYMAAGYGARTAFHSTIGWMTAPITAGAIGGIRARRKANENVNKAFNEGRKEETFLERKEKGKKGLFDDKNKNTNFATEFLAGSKVNTKEVAAFVDADSQKQRIDNLVSKIENAKDEKTRASLMLQLESRLHYIELKQEQGLVNYGQENPVAKNYELFKTMSSAYAASTTMEKLGIPLTKEMREDVLERNKLLTSIMAKNEKSFGREIAMYKNTEMLRGAMVGAGFAILGGMIRDWVHGDGGEHIAEITKGAPIVKPIEEVVKHMRVEAVADHGQGAISTLRELQHNLKVEYPDLSKAPESVKHILNTDAHKLAQEYGMYKPGQDAESAFIKSGEKFSVDENGNVRFGDNLLEKGNEIKADHLYEGKMFDSDHSGVKEIHQEINSANQINPETGEPMSGVAGEGQVNPENGQGLSGDNIKQINPETGEPMSGVAENQTNPETDSELMKGIGAKKIYDHIEPEQKNPEGISYASIKEAVNAGAKPHVPNWAPKTIALEPDYTKEVISNYNENLNNIFPTEKAMDTWRDINNNVNAARFMDMSKNGEISDTYKPLVTYVNKLKNISGLSPERETLINKAESISSYITRATKKIAELGQLDKIKS